MNETLEKKQYSLLRKSGFGRTNLFLTTNGVILREIKCSSSSLARLATASIFHTHSSTYSQKPSELCWHCCHKMKNIKTPFRLPRLYDPNEQVYHVYGWFCGPACTKGYILEHSPFDRGYQMNIFVRMLREVYNITEPVVEAPPRIALKQFGGPFDIETFRQQQNICCTVTPPFVSYCMLVEERQPIESMGETTMANTARCTVKGLRKPEKNQGCNSIEDEIGMPQAQGLYTDFFNNENTLNQEEVDEQQPVAKKRQKLTKEKVKGGLARFSVND